MLITLEGPDGGGKTTQAAGLAGRLAASDVAVTLTREPGGTPPGEGIRTLLLDPGTGDLTPATEALLFCAARAELVERVIRPTLRSGGVVVCDRFYDATLAYQGYGRGLPLEDLRRVIHLATGGLTPDLTVLLDLPVEVGLARRRGSEAWNRLDGADQEFHARVRRGYHALAAEEPGRWRVIAADGDPGDVAASLWEVVMAALVSAGRLAPVPGLAPSRGRQ